MKYQTVRDMRKAVSKSIHENDFIYVDPVTGEVLNPEEEERQRRHRLKYGDPFEGETLEFVEPDPARFPDR